MKAFLYTRVSTNLQDCDMQFREMAEFARRRDWDTETFSDRGVSGSKAARPELDEMLRRAHKKDCDVIMVYRFDRFARSVRHLVNALAEFEALGIQFVSIHENVDTTLPQGKLMFHIFAAIAEFEREMIRERVRSGVAQARAEGKLLGRPVVAVDAPKIAALRKRGLSWRDIAAKTGLNRETCRRAVANKPSSGVAS